MQCLVTYRRYTCILIHRLWMNWKPCLRLLIYFLLYNGKWFTTIYVLLNSKCTKFECIIQKAVWRLKKSTKKTDLIILFAKVFSCRLKETKNNEFENKYSSRVINVYRFDGKSYLVLLINYINHGVPSFINLIENSFWFSWLMTKHV